MKQTLTPQTLMALMSQLTPKDDKDAKRDSPYLSLYQSTHRQHPDNVQDPIRFKNLVKTFESSLSSTKNLYPEALRVELLKPFMDIAEDDDFWRHTLDGIVVLSTKGESHVFHLQRPVPDFAVVADNWHIKPLLRAQQTADKFQVLCLTREWVRLYEGNRNVLDEVDLTEGVPRTITDALGEELSDPYQKVSSYGMGGAGGHGGDMRHGHGGKKDELDIDIDRFFRAIDCSVSEHYSRLSELPLILVTLPEYQGIFRKLSHNNFLLSEGVSIDPGALNIDQLRQKVWAVMEPAHHEKVSKLADEFRNASSKGLGSDQLDETLEAALSGRIRTLLVDADSHVPGRLNMDNRKIIRADNFSDPEVGDVLDDLAELVLKNGGETMVVPREHMPTQNGHAAIYRY